MAISEETFFLDPASGATLQAQIQQMVAEGILTGRFRPGERMPSSRKLAAHLGVSRITVTLAYTELVADDYLVAEGRSGYFVSPNAPEPPAIEARAAKDTVDWSRVLTGWSRAEGPARPADWQRYRYPFIYGQTDPGLFDLASWRLCAVQALGRRDFDALTADRYDTDDEMLIDVITRQILPRRGIRAHPSEVLLTMGAQNALWIAAQLLLTSRRTAAIENPCYPALRGMLEQTRCRLTTVEVDGDGLPPAQLPEGTDVVFTTPSHQCPTTATMPVHRRKALLKRAAEEDFLIVEDDYEFEMSFLGAPSPSLKSLDDEGRVIYVGSFSKSIFPGLRLGYMVGSAPFIAEARALRSLVVRHVPGHVQRTAAYFLSLGHYDAHVRRISRVFRERRETLESAIDAEGLTIAGRGVYGGSSIWMRAPEGCNTEELAERLREQSVLIEPGAAFFDSAGPAEGFYRLAYSSIQAELIPEGVARIARALSEQPARDAQHRQGDRSARP